MTAETGPKPYVVSSDLRGLMQGWSERTGFRLPRDDYFHGMTADLESILDSYFPDGVEVVDEAEIRSGLNELATQRDVPPKQRLPIISLDRAYVDHTTPNVLGYIDMTRGVNEDFTPYGLRERPGAPPLSEQLDKFASEHNFPVILLDDVIFEGASLHWLIQELEKRKRPVVKVITGIGIKKGVESLRSSREVVCVREYEQVVDEVCQRDFVAGAPMSGRTVYHPDGSISSAPYFIPFGNPIEWASVPPDRIQEFSEFCLDESIRVFRKVEKVSASKVPTAAIDRLPRAIGSGDSSFPAALNDIRKGRYAR